MQKRWTTLALVLSLVGCAEEPATEPMTETEEVTERGSESEQSEAAQQAVDRVQPGARELVPPPADPGTAQIPGAEDQRVAQGLEYLGVMMRAAQSAEQEGLSSCEQAYVTSRAVAEAAIADPPAGVELPSLDDFPERELFLEECGKLPEDQQVCIAPAYAMAHPECRAVLQSEAFLAFREAVRPQSARHDQQPGSSE